VLEGLVIVGTRATDLSVNLAGEVFWISVLDAVVTCDAEAKGEDGSLSVCWEPLEDVLVTWRGSKVALVLFSNFV
jgi:hypothetical protein